MNPMPNTILAAQLWLFDQLRRTGHDRESASAVVQQVRPARFFDRDGHLDAAAIAEIAAAHPVMVDAAGAVR